MFLIYLIVLTVCARGVIVSAAECPKSLDGALFEGSCWGNVKSHVFSFLKLQTSLQEYWMQDINATCNSTALSNETLSFIDTKLAETRAKIEQYEINFSQLSMELEKKDAAVTKLVADNEELKKKYTELEMTLTRLTKRLEKLELQAPSRSNGMFLSNAQVPELKDISNDKSLLTRACLVRHVLGGEPTDTCKEILYA